MKVVDCAFPAKGDNSNRPIAKRKRCVEFNFIFVEIFLERANLKLMIIPEMTPSTG